MPNHCETDLIISGPKEILEKIASNHFLEDGSLNCDSVIPYPSKYKKLDEMAKKWDIDNKNNPEKDYNTKPKDGFNSGGYEWCCNNWGTKWGTYEGVRNKTTSKSFCVSFLSAWSPPIPVLEKLAEIYPQVSIKMKSYESGQGYKLKYSWKNGSLIENSQTSYRGIRGG